MKTLFIATILMVVAITSSGAQNGPSIGPNSASPLPAQVKVFELTPDQAKGDFMCNQGMIQSLLVARIPDELGIRVLFLDSAKKEIPADTWASAYGFRFPKNP